MRRGTGALKARQVETLPAGFHSDGGNLYLRVKDTGARSWVFRYKQTGKVRELGIGPTHTRSLADARQVADAMRRAVRDGVDPSGVLQKKDPSRATFQTCAQELIEAKRAGWRSDKHALQWASTLKAYAYPAIGDKAPQD